MSKEVKEVCRKCRKGVYAEQMAPGKALKQGCQTYLMNSEVASVAEAKENIRKWAVEVNGGKCLVGHGKPVDFSLHAITTGGF